MAQGAGIDMEFSPQVSLGSVIQLVSMLVLTVGAFINLRESIKYEAELRKRLEDRVTRLEKSVDDKLTILANEMRNGFSRMYDKLDSKADK